MNSYIIHFSVSEGLLGEKKHGKLLALASSLEEGKKEIEKHIKEVIFPLLDDPYYICEGGYIFKVL